MDAKLIISSIGLGFIVPLLVQAFKKVNWSFGWKVAFAIFISALVGTGNAYLNDAFKNGIANWNTLSQAFMVVFASSQLFWKTTFESHFSGK